jgi:hypothetical protein
VLNYFLKGIERRKIFRGDTDRAVDIFARIPLNELAFIHPRDSATCPGCGFITLRISRDGCFRAIQKEPGRNHMF